MNDLDPRDEYLGAVGGMMFGPEIEVGSLWDKTVYTKGVTKERIDREIERVVQSIKTTVFPIHQLSF